MRATRIHPRIWLAVGGLLLLFHLVGTARSFEVLKPFYSNWPSSLLLIGGTLFFIALDVGIMCRFVPAAMFQSAMSFVALVGLTLGAFLPSYGRTKPHFDAPGFAIQLVEFAVVGYLVFIELTAGSKPPTAP